MIKYHWGKLGPGGGSGSRWCARSRLQGRVQKFFSKRYLLYVIKCIKTMKWCNHEIILFIRVIDDIIPIQKPRTDAIIESYSSYTRLNHMIHTHTLLYLNCVIHIQTISSNVIIRKHTILLWEGGTWWWEWKTLIRTVEGWIRKLYSERYTLVNYQRNKNDKIS